MAFLDLDSISKRFGELVVLDDVSLELARGETLALLGPSGSGKTTLLRILAGFEAADRGSIRVEGERVDALAPARRGFGMVFQHYALFPHLDVRANVAFGLHGRPAAERRERVTRALARVDLAGFEERPIEELSGGQQQRVAVARALAPEPRLLLLDEPLSNLDPALRERTRRKLQEVIRAVGIPTVLVTHEQHEAFDLGDRVAVLWRGRLQQVGSPEALYERPANPFVAGFVGRANLLSGRLAGAGVALAGLDVVWPGTQDGDLEPGQPVLLMLRPESLTFVDDGPLAVAGELVDRLYLGGRSRFLVRTAGGTEIEVESPDDPGRPGSRARVAPKPGVLPGRIWADDETESRR